MREEEWKWERRNRGGMEAGETLTLHILLSSLGGTETNNTLILNGGPLLHRAASPSLLVQSETDESILRGRKMSHLDIIESGRGVPKVRR